MQLHQIFNEFVAPQNILGHVAYVLTIVSMIMRTMRWLRFFAVLSGLVASGYYAFVRGDHVSAFWEAAYVAVNVTQLFLLWYENRIGQFDDVQREFVSRALMGLQPVYAAKVVHQAKRETIPENHVVVSEGLVPDRLYYIVSGEVQIAQRGVVVGRCGAGDFLGEMSLLTGGAANASASTCSECQVLVFERPALEGLMVRMEPVRHALNAGISHNLLVKISRMNAFRADLQSA